MPRTLGLSVVLCLGLVLSLSAQKPAPPKRPAAKPAAPAAPAAQAPATSTTPSAADAEAITAVVQAYFTAINARDLEAALRLWTAQSTDAMAIRQTMPQIFEARDPLWSDVEVTPLTVEGAKARARLVFKVVFRRPVQQFASPPRETRDIVELARVGSEWRLVAEKSESQDAAERVIAAPDEAALTRLLTEERDQMGLNVVRSLLGIASFAAAQQRWDAAVAAFNRAIRLAETPVAPLSDSERESNMAEMHLATALSGLAQVLVARPQPDLPRAVELLTRSLELSERTKSDTGIINTLQALGNAFYSAGDYAEALDRYQRVLPVAARQKDTDATARTNLGIGNVQYLFGQYDLARAAYASAVEIYDLARDQNALPRALQGLGRVYAATGDFDAARAQFQRALVLLRQTIQKSDQAAVMCDLGRLDFQQGRMTEARTQFQEALTLAESIGDPLNIGRAQYSLGLVHVVERDFDGAIDRYTRAADALMTMAPPHVDAAGQAVLARASARFEQRDLPRALEDFTACLGMFEKARNREGMARAHLGIAMTHRRRNQAKLALDAATRAFDFGERAAAPDVRWQARYEAGQGYLLAGDPVKARQAFEEAIRILEDTRFEGGAEAEAQAPSQRAAPYVALVEWHIARGDATSALMVADAAKRRMIEDLLRPFNFRLTRGLSPERQAEERRLVNQRVTLLRQVRRERDLMRPNPARIAKLEQSLAAARAANVEWNQALARDVPALAYQRGNATLTSLDPLAAALTADTALIHFIVGDDRTSILVATHGSSPAAAAGGVPPPDAGAASAATRSTQAAVASAAATATTRDASQAATTASTAAGGGVEAPPRAATAGPATTRGSTPAVATAPGATALTAGAVDVFAFTVPITRAQLIDQVWRFTEGIAKRADTVNADARALYELLLAPARERLAGRPTLVVVPDDALWTLPFEAVMPADDRYLIQDATITTMPSAATWVAQPSRASASAALSSPSPSSPASPSAAASSAVSSSAAAPASDVSASPSAAGATPGVFAAWAATGEFSDISPMQTRLTFASGDLPSMRADAPKPAPLPEGAVPQSDATAPTPGVAGGATGAAGALSDAAGATNASTATLAAWELFDREAGADEILLAEVRPKAERPRLDSGRLGATALYWALQAAGARRVVLARRALPTDAPVTSALPLPHPYEWATWLVIGPPQPPAAPVSQPAQAARLP